MLVGWLSEDEGAPITAVGGKKGVQGKNVGDVLDPAKGPVNHGGGESLVEEEGGYFGGSFVEVGLIDWIGDREPDRMESSLYRKWGLGHSDCIAGGEWAQCKFVVVASERAWVPSDSCTNEAVLVVTHGCCREGEFEFLPASALVQIHEEGAEGSLGPVPDCAASAAAVSGSVDKHLEIPLSFRVSYHSLRDPTLLIFGHPVWRGAGRSEDLLVGLLLGLAKLAINRSRQQAVEGVIMADCLPLFRGYVHAWVSLEKVCTGTLDAFPERALLQLDAAPQAALAPITVTLQLVLTEPPADGLHQAASLASSLT
eukprot:g46578.t1